MPTATSPVAESPKPAETPHVARIVSSDSIPAGGFTPGTILADRYRIIGLLGRGGMGEVYRADDLKLGQPVALKFLPAKLADDPVRRERFFAEVRITRQLSHPNICRVYDIAEIEGRHFLSMEYIDGEDLASLLKRIGHLTNEKALDIARQLAAGLAAAHERGVLHRDLKPANIMLDGHGRVRITDFGLAIAQEDESQATEIAGTPAYMAPEQLAGKGATVRSDMYSLGLVLYEIYTGKKAFTATNLAELRQQKETQTPRAPSEIRQGIDPVVERVIQRCMEKDPNARPASVAQLAQALPGGDPLAAAIAAGETPSPEMVAASGSKEGLKPWVAWICLVSIVACIGLTVVLKRQTSLYEKVPIEHPPEVMATKARDLLKSIGYPGPPVDSAYYYYSNVTYLEALERSDQSPHRFENLSPMAVRFVYRQSAQLLQHWRSSPGVWWGDPPFTDPGGSVILLDSRGDLLLLQVISAGEPKSSGTETQTDWSFLFKYAGLDPEKFHDAEPQNVSPVYSDIRKAWTGTLPGHPNIPIRIEAASLGGKPVWFQQYIENKASRPESSTTPKFAAIVLFFLLFPILGCIFVARRNTRTGRGDRRGAWRLACFIFGLQATAWVFAEHHIAAPGELGMFFVGSGEWLFFAGIGWLLYIALEPFVRRRWPVVLVGWNRLLAGDYRDPLVGRDFLVGCLAGGLAAFLYYVTFPLTSFFGYPQLRPSTGAMFPGSAYGGAFDFFAGTPMTIAGILNAFTFSMIIALFIGGFLFLMRILLKKTWAAIVAFMLAIIAILSFSSLASVSSVSILLIMSMFVFIFFRFGILALAACLFYDTLLALLPITTQTSAWYFRTGLAGLALLLAFAIYAFHTSLGGRPIFGTPRLDD